MPRKPMIDTMQRPKFDKLYTPAIAVEALMRQIAFDLAGDELIWECTDSGGSQITKVVEDWGHTAIPTSIETGFDFLTQVATFPFDIIITNPPYSLKDKFLERCYAYKKPFALLLPLTALEGVKRGKMFRENNISVIVLDRRLDFTGKGANWFPSAWFCHGLMPEPLLYFAEI